MKNPRFLRWGTPMFLLLIGPFSPGIATSRPVQETTVPGQDEEKVIEEKDFFKAPMKIERIKSRIGAIEFGKKIQTADDDWLRGLSVTVRNLSDKPVTHLMLNLEFVHPKEQTDEKNLIDSVDYGPIPGVPLAQQPQFLAVQPPIPPGGSADVAYTEQSYEGLLQILRELNFPARIKKVKVSVSVIDYGDGTRWAVGKVFKRDQTNPRKWVPVNSAQEPARESPAFLEDPASYNYTAVMVRRTRTIVVTLYGNYSAMHRNLFGRNTRGSNSVKFVELDRIGKSGPWLINYSPRSIIHRFGYCLIRVADKILGASTAHPSAERVEAHLTIASLRESSFSPTCGQRALR